MSKVTGKLKEELERIIKAEQPQESLTTDRVQTTQRKVRSSGGIVVDGETGCAVKFAKCCNPSAGRSCHRVYYERVRYFNSQA